MPCVLTKLTAAVMSLAAFFPAVLNAPSSLPPSPPPPQTTLLSSFEMMPPEVVQQQGDLAPSSIKSRVSSEDITTSLIYGLEMNLLSWRFYLEPRMEVSSPEGSLCKPLPAKRGEASAEAPSLCSCLSFIVMMESPLDFSCSTLTLTPSSTAEICPRNTTSN